ncbi:hypothetical protein JRQ81_000371, partial [Phrynocephalus forsythii]
HLKRKCVLNTDILLENMSEELSERHHTELNEREKIQVEAEETKRYLKSLSLEKDQTEIGLKNLENLYHLNMRKLQTEHEQELLNVREQSKKQEGMLQQEIEKLKARLEELKMESEEEIKHLWSQLDGARTSWQELSELKEQLLTRTSHIEEMECLKKDYQIKWDKKRIEHENELEQLRLYFEQKLKMVEENYREELIMLQQRLQEVKDSSLEMENSQDQLVELGPSLSLLEEMTENERYSLFEQLTQQLEHYKEELSNVQMHLDKKHREELESLRCSLKLQYEESLMKMKMDLSEKYTSEIEQLKRRHSLHLEELRARISEEHLREIAKLHLQNAQDAAQQIETEVAERLLVLEGEYKAKYQDLQIEMQSISMQQEEIEKLRRENDDLKKMSVSQEMHLKEEFEQTEHKTKCLRDDVEGASGELKNLQEKGKEKRREEIPRTLLKSDIELCINEKEKLQESCQQMLKLLLKMVKSAKDTEDLIYSKTGLSLTYSLASGNSGESQLTTGELVLTETSTTVETWCIQKSNGVDPGKFLDQTVPENSFASLMADEISELSQHLCESVFENPDLILEKQIHKICHGLHTAVEKLLDQLAESTKQLEEIHAINIHLEDDIKARSSGVCHDVNDHHELMDCFNEESKVNRQLVLELHKTKGLMGGCLAEIQALEEALKLKEESQCHLVLELETLKAQVQDLTQQLARSAEEQKLLTDQNETLAANVGERETDLIKKIEHLSKAKLEVECQAEKDHSTLKAHMKMLEMELEEQLSKNQNLAVMSLEVTDLRQQMQALERQLTSQRNFMDKQAAEREHERDAFQEEIQKLEMELKLTAKFKASEHSKADLVESLQNEIKERTEDYNRLFLDRERIQKELVARNEEIEKLEAQIRELECRNEELTNNAAKLTQQLKDMKEMEAELKQDKEALQQEQYNNLIQISALHTKLDEARHRGLLESSRVHPLNEQLNAQEETIAKERKIASLLQQLEQFKETVVSKNEELFQLSSELQLEKNMNLTQILQLKEENAHLKENIEKLDMQNQNPADGELIILQFLKSLLEEKNQETDHLNEQIILENQVLEIQDMKSVIEHLHGDKEQLLRDKTQEVKQLSEVIEKLQKELGLLVPMCHKVYESQDTHSSSAEVQPEDNILNETRKASLVSRDEKDYVSLNPITKQLQGQLEKKYQFETEVKILEQNLQNVQESSPEPLTKLTASQPQYDDLQQDDELLKKCLRHTDTKLRVGSACIQEQDDHLQDKQAVLSEKELQFQRASGQNAEEVQHVKENVQFENELYVLTQALHDKEATHQREMSELQLTIGELKSQVEKKVEELDALRTERDLFHSQLKLYMETGRDKQEETKLHQVDLKLDTVLSEERDEGREERKAMSAPSFENKLEENTTLTEMKMSSKNHNVQEKHLQSLVLIQEEKMTTKGTARATISFSRNVAA